jgi:lysophospholipase L1-like esterase
VHADCLRFRLNGWPALVREAIDAAGVPNVTMLNHAMNGATLQEIYDGWTPSTQLRTCKFSECLQIDKPTVVVIFGGTNDVPRGLPAYFKVSVLMFEPMMSSSCDARARLHFSAGLLQPLLKKMIGEAQAAEASVIVSTLL